MSRARQPPLVTGISPNEGTSWTKVTIRGENLGTGTADLVGLSICGHNCLLTAEWMSASKIVCRVGPAKDDKGEIIVTTKSGGNGTSTVSFKLLKAEKIGILDQSAVWVDEMNYYDMRTDRNKGISPLSLRPSNPLGIDIDKGKVPLKDLEAMFSGVSGEFTSENFSATWYLIENHSVTSFDQLRIAASNLKKQATKKNEGSLAYVKGGLSTFFEAQDALAGKILYTVHQYYTESVWYTVPQYYTESWARSWVKQELEEQFSKLFVTQSRQVEQKQMAFFFHKTSGSCPGSLNVFYQTIGLVFKPFCLLWSVVGVGKVEREAWSESNRSVCRRRVT
ncbi:unnamed protein product [Coregonus sp. 'balchen']|nr:unnamed protein product [Coregonus sp. 'balchen']